jgi:hypothetical protein
METFEFLVTSTVQATLYEHIKIQALNYEDAVTRIKDRDYYEEDGEIIDSKTEKDLGVIEAFCEYIAYNNKIMYREDTKSYRISFANSIENPKFMEKYGFKPRKTYNPIDFFVFKDYDKELLLALLIGIIDGDGSIQPNGSSNAFCITITAHESWTQFYQEFMETLDIPEHISNREGSTTITIRICRREILQLLQDVITNNNLFHLKRKWNKLMIKEPSASES